MNDSATNSKQLNNYNSTTTQQQQLQLSLRLTAESEAQSLFHIIIPILNLPILSILWFLSFLVQIFIFMSLALFIKLLLTPIVIPTAEEVRK